MGLEEYAGCNWVRHGDPPDIDGGDELQQYWAATVATTYATSEALHGSQEPSEDYPSSKRPYLFVDDWTRGAAS